MGEIQIPRADGRKVRPIVYTVSETGCWICTSHSRRKEAGYIQVTRNQIHQNMTRLIWEHFHGSPPGEKLVCHTCDYPPCINPEHLFLGTTQENATDMVQKGRSLQGERNPATQLSSVQVLDIRRRFRAGETLKRLAKEFGLDHVSICLITTRKTWTNLPEEDYTVDVRRKTFSTAVIQGIRRAYREGTLISELARKYGVSHPSMCKIVYQKSYRYIPEEV